MEQLILYNFNNIGKIINEYVFLQYKENLIRDMAFAPLLQKNNGIKEYI